MIHVRVLGVLTALGLTAVLGAAGVAPAGAQGPGPATVATQSQTISFTSTPPSGEDWYTASTVAPWDPTAYIARAVATSGLPVTYSIAPESAGICAITQIYQDDPYFGSGAGIRFQGAGTCTVRADQSGDDQYVPAPQATQSFQLDKVQTWMSQVKGRKGLPGSTAATFSATLKTWEYIDSHTVSIEPFRHEPVTFTVAGRPACSASTDSNGVATCRVVLPRSDLLRLRFTATYAGNANYKPVSGSAFFLG